MTFAVKKTILTRSKMSKVSQGEVNSVHDSPLKTRNSGVCNQTTPV